MRPRERGSPDAAFHASFSAQVQRAVSASHVRHVVEPLERAGLTVDVFLATYGCGGIAPPARAARAMAHLVEWYGAARVARAEQLPRRGSSQATPALVAMRWLRALWPPGGYRSVLLWRFDNVALRPLGAAPAPAARAASTRPAGDCDASLDVRDDWEAHHRPYGCWCWPLATCDSDAGWGGYANARGAAPGVSRARGRRGAGRRPTPPPAPGPATRTTGTRTTGATASPGGSRGAPCPSSRRRASTCGPSS